MPSPIIRSISLGTDGRAVALRRDGSLTRQVPMQGDASYSSKWVEVTTDDLPPVRITQIAVRFPDGSLVALLADGSLHETFLTFHDQPGVYKWRPIPVAT